MYVIHYLIHHHQDEDDAPGHHCILYVFIYIRLHIYVWWLKIASATSNKPEYKSDYILALNCDFTYNNKQNCAFAYHSTRRIQRVTVCRGSPQIRIYIYFSHCRSSMLAEYRRHSILFVLSAFVLSSFDF